MLPCSFFLDHHYLSLSAMQACWGRFVIAFSEAQGLFKRHKGHSSPLVSSLPFSGLQKLLLHLMWDVCTKHQDLGGVLSSRMSKSPKELYIFCFLPFSQGISVRDPLLGFPCNPWLSPFSNIHSNIPFPKVKDTKVMRDMGHSSPKMCCLQFWF